MADQLLRAENMTVGYGGVPLIRDIALSVSGGEILTLVGPNGSGKSTILKSLIRELALLGGTVYLDGRDSSRLSAAETARTLAVMMTGRIAPERMTCWDVAAAGRYPYTGRLGILGAEDREKVCEALALVHAEELADRDFTCISDGQRQRVLLGCAIVISANCGGALTVIGDPSGIVLWNMGAVTASNFSASMALPCLIAWLVPIFWIGRQLPTRIETQWIVLPYRGDDTRLNVWQRVVMLFVGIGGLWFIPTFHSITKLSPFLGALCVLCVLWIVNEIVNRKLMNTDEMIQRRVPRVLQYGVIQMMLFVLGIMLIVGFVRETGVAAYMAQLVDRYMSNLLVLGFFTQMLSSVLDNFMSLMTMVSLRDVADSVQATVYAQNGAFWKMMAYASAVGGNILCIGSITGLALMKMERIPLGWYAKNVGMVAFLAATAGLVAMYFIVA